MSYTKELDIALEAAQKAGKYLMAQRGKVRLTAAKPDWKDFLTKQDVESEQIIVEHIKKAFPEDAFITEEKMAFSEKEERTWIIDPIDGTANYLAGIPFFSVSIGFIKNNVPCVGVVYAPALKQMFCAEIGKGAKENNFPLHTSQAKVLSESLIIVGFNRFKGRELKDVMNKYEKLINVTRDVRRLGSAAIDLCYVASDRAGAYMERALKPWDIAAGLCILKEAGGTITNEDGGELDLFRKTEKGYECEGFIATSNKSIHEKIKERLI